MKRGRSLVTSSYHQADNRTSDSERPFKRVKSLRSFTPLCRTPAINQNTLSVNSTKKESSSCAVVTPMEMREFFDILDNDSTVREFLQMDSCMRLADKYLLAMAFAYFKRADYALCSYTSMNFFVALYLAHDLEEDDEELKFEIFPWALGKKWRDRYTLFIERRDQLLRRINYKAVVSRRCCDEIMRVCPGHPAWRRERKEHHGGAIRNYMKAEEDVWYPRGPNASPIHCPQCEPDDSQCYSSDTSMCTWYISDSDESPINSDDTMLSYCTAATTAPSASRFEMKGLESVLTGEDSNSMECAEQ